MDSNIKFITAKTKEGFNKNVNDIPKKSITFIEDTLEIYADGKLYNTIKIPTDTPTVDSDGTWLATVNGQGIYAKIGEYLSKTGTAIAAKKLDIEDVGSELRPVYFKNGVPVLANTLSDTHYESNLIVSNIETGKEDISDSIANGLVRLNLTENNTVRSSINIIGDGYTGVTKDDKGRIVVTSTAPVKSVNTKTGNVTLDKSDIGLSNVENLTPAEILAKDVTTKTYSENDKLKIANLEYVKNAIANSVSGVVSSMRFVGTVGTGGDITALPTSNVQKGDVYLVKAAGNFASQACEAGDMIIATSTTPTWTVVQANIDGAVTGPSSAVVGNVALFNATTGKVIKDSGFTIGKSVPSNAVFTDTTYDVFTGSTTSTAGTKGLVPAPAANTTSYYLRADGTWASPSDTKYTGGTGISISGTTVSLKTASVSEIGGIKASNVLTISQELTSANGATAGRYYGVQVDKDGKAFVNVPWVNNTYDLSNYLPLSGGTMTGAITTFNGSLAAPNMVATGNIYIKSSSVVGFMSNNSTKSAVALTTDDSFRPVGDSAGLLSLGTTGSKWKDAYFSGTVYAGTLNENGTALSSKYLQLSGGTMTGAINGSLLTLNGSNAVVLKAENSDAMSVLLNYGGLRPTEASNGVLNLGSSSAKWKDGYFRGTVYATTFSGTLNGSALNLGVNSAVYTSSSYTVADVKAKLLSFTASSNVTGESTLLPSTAINNWGNDSATMAAGSIYTAIRISGGYANPAQYAQWILGHYSNNRIGVMGINNGSWTSIRWLAYEDGTVEKANKLATARTIWGQSFDGTGNIDGKLTLNCSTADCLSIKRTAAASGAFVDYYSNNQSANLWRVGMSGENNFVWVYYTASGSNNIATITSSGNVGIGTTSPAYKLDVSGTGRFTGKLRVDGGNAISAGEASDDAYGIVNVCRPRESGVAKSFFSMVNNGVTARGIGLNYDGYIVMGSVATNKTISAAHFAVSSETSYVTGNFGVGTTSPAYKLDVSGTGRFTGTLYANSGITTAGAISGSTTLELRSVNGDIYLKRNNTDTTSVVLNATTFKPFDAANKLLDLGSTSAYWKNGYFSGTVYAGTFSGTATNATTATKLGTATVGSATLPIYLNAGTPTACTAASIFSGFSVSGKTLSATIAGQARSVTISNATYADMLTPNSALTYGASGLQYFNLSGTAGTTANSNNTPTSGWYHIIRMNHGDSNGYFADIAVSLNHANGMYWRYISYGSNYGWYKILDSNNWSSYCAAASHTHSYLPLSGGTLTGAVTGTQFIASDWLRSTGSTGWYHNTYGGGIYMTDSTWIRTYNSKNFYCNAQVKCGTLVSDGAATMSSTLSVSGTLTVGSSSANSSIVIGGATLTYNATTGYLECNKSIKLTSGDYIA